VKVLLAVLLGLLVLGGGYLLATKLGGR